jgi:metallophosphoesterase (TIGR00282 family)
MINTRSLEKISQFLYFFLSNFLFNSFFFLIFKFYNIYKVLKLNSKISLIFLGDIVAQPGFNIVKERLPELIERYQANMVVVNGENCDNGKGIIKEQADELFELGVDIITTGNHIWNNWNSRPLLYAEPRVLRPMNYPTGNPGLSYNIFTLKTGQTVAVLQLQGRSFMQSIDCPFKAADNVLKRLHQKTDNIILDFHAETTAEKQSLAWYLDGKVSAFIGTHTHVQTADAQILPKGTAYITDAGMTGSYDSVIGMDKDVSIKRFTLGTAQKYQPATGEAKICGVYVEIDSYTGQAMKIETICEPKFYRSMTDAL